ncbi:excalibur calcium-binding domain-containing protein [Cupriavidus taiwanensis]|nr:excalibur calcium-binding domain-containing protein [Cupriavidus taiwanensis]MDK3024662.1 excalibur calcium-binding domain-containing protein [Cupriavidus taiwanensis]
MRGAGWSPAAVRGQATLQPEATCAEARFYLKNCPAVKMDGDGDGDGIPCETPPLQCAF